MDIVEAISMMCFPCAFTPTSSAQCLASRRPITQAATSCSQHSTSYTSLASQTISGCDIRTLVQSCSPLSTASKRSSSVPGLMDMLRTTNALNKWDMTLNTAQYKRMYQRISAIEFSILRIGEYPIPSIIDIVNSIRLAKGNVIAEWKQSDTAKLFEDHGYKNKKESGGYFL